MTQPLAVAYGLGVDSTAALVGLRNLGHRPDLILFADTGNEKQETYDYLPIINRWLTQVDFPQVTVVTNVVKNFKHWPPYRGLGENCLTNGTLPSLAFGFKSCSLKWKVTPQNKFCETWQLGVDWWAGGGKVRKVIGYDASPKDRKRFAHAVGVEDPLYDYWYPLIDWGWDRERCKRVIAEAGLPVPPKSACYFCPATQPAELHEFKKVYLRYIVIMESRAKPRLEGHIPQDELDRQWKAKMVTWREKCAAIRASGKDVTGKLPLAPRKPKNATGVLGLWRRGNKGKKSGTPLPGMMTDYIRANGLLPAAEIDELIARAPQEIIDNQQAFANGVEIPEWHDFIEAFTPEDAIDEIGMPRLKVLNNCDGCSAV